MDASLVARITDFQHRFAAEQASEIIDLGWGFVFLQKNYPDSHMHNRVTVSSSVDAAEVISAADEILGGAGCAHRFVSVLDDTLGKALTPQFSSAGFDVEILSTMVHTLPADTGQAQAAAEKHVVVRAVPFEELRGTMIDSWRADLPDASAQVHAQLADRTLLYSRSANVELLAAYDGDQIGAKAELYLDPATELAQFESLVTLGAHRRRGLGSALVFDALARCVEAEVDRCFLEAVVGDWPQLWYRRLGFSDIAQTHNFTRISPPT